MKTFKVSYVRKGGRYRIDYFEAESLGEVISKFAAEMTLGAHQDIMDNFEISEVVMFPYGGEK